MQQLSMQPCLAPRSGRWVYVLVYLTAMGLLSAVSLLPSQEKPESNSVPLEYGVITSKGGRYIVEYVAEPSPIPLNEMFGLHVTVRERHKHTPTHRVSLEVDAGMLEHNHGMNIRPMIERLPDGTFRVRGMLFHMAGEWHLTFFVKHGLMRDKAETDLVVQ